MGAWSTRSQVNCQMTKVYSSKITHFSGKLPKQLYYSVFTVLLFALLVFVCI